MGTLCLPIDPGLETPFFESTKAFHTSDFYASTVAAGAASFEACRRSHKWFARRDANASDHYDYYWRNLSDPTVVSASLSLEIPFVSRGGTFTFIAKRLNFVPMISRRRCVGVSCSVVTHCECVPFASLLRSQSSGRSDNLGLLITANEKPGVWELLFDMQTETSRSIGKEQRHNYKAPSLTPSFRTPNIQLDVRLFLFLSVAVADLIWSVSPQRIHYDRGPRRIFCCRYSDSVPHGGVTRASFIQRGD
jgi:hypothetical protein